MRLLEQRQMRNGKAYRKDALSEDDDVHVERLKVRRAVLILLETSETDKVVGSEKFDLFASFLHENIFCCKRVNREDLFFSAKRRKKHSKT